ncbi:MAG: hypothetical protein SGI92_19940 [Bryobacteraceae bacterium]|nr:hypothetical protein [Bryobacteraceae bacterium]
MKQLGGGLDVTTTPGEGSSFTTFISFSNQRPARQDAPKPVTGIRKGLRILLAEASNGAALELASHLKVASDVVLSDVVMPEMQGPVA